MADKKYYWLKLHRDFFKRHDIRIIEAMPNGKDYVLFYLKLLVESIDHNGELRFSETIPYSDEMLAVVTNTNVDVVRQAVKIFEQLQMLEVKDDETIFMEEAKKLVGFETEWAKKKREYRDEKTLEKRTLSSNCPQSVLEVSSNCPPVVRQEKEKEIEIDIEIDKEIDKKHKGTRKRVYFEDAELNEAFLEWLDMRKSIKKPASEGAITRAIKSLEKLASDGGLFDAVKATDIVNQSTDHCWQGFFELKGNGRPVQQSGDIDWSAIK